jgi:ribosomal protein S18 acetylase RimI-like enzyme
MTAPLRAAFYLRVSTARQAERLGVMLLADAAQRAYASAAIVGSSMLVVDAINERAAAFYEENGFDCPSRCGSGSRCAPFRRC